MNKIKKGNIYYCDLSPTVGSEQGGLRPVLVIQNNIGNTHSPTTIIAVITSRKTKANIPTHFLLNTDCLPYKSMVECEQVRTVDKRRLREYLGSIDSDQMAKIDECLRISLALV